MQRYILTVGPSLGNKIQINEIHQDDFIYRINGAHGSLEDIKNTIINIRNQNNTAKILIDLPGNKI
ncbi:pyruvate kinase, partial [Campylobacter coli]|nr:pyruvate kinase [Campylobacter coli]